MDFRQAPAPETLAWQPPRGAGKTKTATATFAGKKIVVQTPECAARAFKNAGSTTLYLALDRSNNDVHAAFATWIETLESYALATHRDAFANLAMSTSVRDNGSFRLMVWDDAQWFHQNAFFKDGVPEIAAGQGATCIVEFCGCWSTDATWGLKWRVTQVQLGGVGEKTPARAPVATVNYAFADDD